MPLLDYNIISYPTEILGASINKKKNIKCIQVQIWCVLLCIKITLTTFKINPDTNTFLYSESTLQGCFMYCIYKAPNHNSSQLKAL